MDYTHEALMVYPLPFRREGGREEFTGHSSLSVDGKNTKQ